MSLSQTQTLQSKRQQFHTEIRKKQLDDYRKRKREQIFGKNGIKPKVNYQEVMFMRIFPQEFKEKVAESPYPFSQQFRDFFIKDFEQKLQNNNFSLESINEVLNHLVVMALNQVSNFENYQEDVLFSVMRLISKMMEKVCEIPHNSMIRQNSHQLIEQIYNKVFYSIKTILKGILAEQDFQQSLNQKRNKLKQMEESMKKKTFQSSYRQINEQQFRQNFQKLQKNTPPLKHPIQCCIKQLRDLLQMFFATFLNSESLHQKYPSQQTQQLAGRHLRYSSMLWYMVSHLRSGLFTAHLFEYLHQQLKDILDISPQMVEIFVVIFSNFLQNETHPDNRQIKQQGAQVIVYDGKLIKFTFGMFECFLTDFQLSSSCLLTIVKSLTNAIVKRKFLIQLIMESQIFTTLLQIIKTSHRKLVQLAELHMKNKIPHHQFIEEAEKIHLLWSQKYEIYQFFGSMFSLIQEKDQEFIYKITQNFPTLVEIIFYELNKIVLSEIKSKALRQAVELESEDEREKVVLAVLFMLLNLFAFSLQIIEKFIQQNLLNYIMGLWRYFNYLQNSMLEVQYDNFGKLREIRTVKYAIISIIWNILVQLYRQEDETQQNNHAMKNRTEALTIVTEFRDFGMIKIILEFLSTTVYKSDSIIVDKESVKFSFFSLSSFFKFILWSSMQERLCSSLQLPQLNISLVKEMLSHIMARDEVYEKGIIELALECLNLMDRITENANYNDDGLRWVDSRHYQQEQNYYGENNQDRQQNRDVEI